MIDKNLTDFFATSTGASATLIGLLFVAIAVEPRRIVGAESPIESRAKASSSFAAFVNLFFVSITGLWQQAIIGYDTLFFAIVFGISNSLGLGVTMVREITSLRQLVSRAPLVLISLAIYVLEAFLAYELIQKPTVDHLNSLIGVLIFLYGLALARAWDLLGAQDQSFLHSLFALRTRTVRSTRGRAEVQSRPETLDGAPMDEPDDAG